MKIMASLYPYARWDGVDSMARAARAMDRLGFHGLAFPDHVVVKDDENARTFGDDWPDALVLAAYLAGQTTTLRFVYHALVVPYRNPVVLAKQIATLDLVSGGRTQFAVGTGWLPAEFEILGVPFERRGERLDEYLTVMKKLWTGETVSHHGETISFDDVRCVPRPVQRPHPPLLIGGSGPRPLDRVLRHGDGWAPMLGTAESLAADIGRIKDRARADGGDPDRYDFMFTLQIGDGDADVDRAFEHVKADGQLHARAEPEGLAAETVRQLTELGDAGVTQVMVVFGWRDVDEYVAKLEWVAEEIMPAVS